MSRSDRQSSPGRIFSGPVLLVVVGLAALASMWIVSYQRTRGTADKAGLGDAADGQAAAGSDLAAPAIEYPSSTPRFESDPTETNASQPLAAEPAPQAAAPSEPQLAPLGPPVAEQIDFDPSIHQSPPLRISRSIRDLEPELPSPGSLELSPISSSVQPQIPALPEPDHSLEPAEPPAEAADLEPPASAFPATKAWPYPAGLVEQLNILAATTPVTTEWADRVKAEIDRLVQVESLADPAADGPLERLDQLADEAKTFALTQPDESEVRSRLLRTGYAIVRRLAIWQQVRQQAARPDLPGEPAVDRQAWPIVLAAIDSQLHDTGASTSWRQYLLIDRARTDFDSAACSPGDQRQLALDMLHRLHSSQLSHEQEEFLQLPEFQALDQQLRTRALLSPDFTSLLRAIENHEHDDTSANARALAAEFAALRWSPDAGIDELASTINAYYRNANLRVALSSELINRLIPQQQPQFEPVQDTILGARVEGQSQTLARLRLVLLPDPTRWHIGLEADGQVDSDTSSSKGPATFYSKSNAFFRARKKVTVDRRGIRLFNAEANADSNTNLNDFETDFDGIPLLSNLARAVVRNQYDNSQYEAKLEVEGKIVGRATTQLDRQVSEQLEKGKRDFQARMVAPLQKMNLEPTTIDLETTADRLIGRYRLAGHQQISAHTPRPQAPGDSLLSVQIHETAFNNFLERLHLHGRRVEIRELFQEMTTRFERDPIPIPEDLPEDVYVTFADDDPVRLDCQDGRVRLTIRLKELTSGTKNKWQNFTVRGYYAPYPDQRDANLVREGIIELIGDERLTFGDQIALRAIFARVLSRNQKLNLVNKQIAQAKQLTDQQVTQFVIYDGWIGIALGPQTPGRRVAMYPRPPSEDDTQME